MKPLLTIFQKYTDYTDEISFLELFFSAIKDGIREEDIVLVNFLDGIRFYKYRKGSFKRKVHILESEKNNIIFIVSKPNKREAISLFLGENVIDEYQKKIRMWHLIFRSTHREIWENSKRFKEDKPLRFGLTKKDKKFLLTVARKALEMYVISRKLPTKKDFKNIPERFLNEKISVDVTIWVEGYLRGSWVIEESDLITAVIHAARRSFDDFRYKSISKNELEKARIEIIIISPIKVPLSRHELLDNDIDTSKGYKLVYQGNQGWYLPMVFNSRQYDDLDDLLRHLGKDKALISKSQQQRSVTYMFEVIDFVESKNKQEVLTLQGPIVEHDDRTIEVKDTYTHSKKYQESFFASAEWLSVIQEPDGYMPAIVDPLTGKKRHSLVRSLFAAWALIELGNVSKESTYITVGQKAFKYYVPFFEENERLLNQNFALFAYAGRLSLSLHQTKEAFLYAARIEPALIEALDPITKLQTASLFFELGNIDQDIYKEHKNVAYEITISVLGQLHERLKQQKPVSLAQFAELLPLLYYRSCETNDAEHRKEYTKLVEWYATQQLPCGAFPNTTHDNFTYTRGTSKIFEVLTVDADNAHIFTPALNWLLTYQYDIENTFFVPDENKNITLGGIRHDTKNYTIWIDSVGHTLLGAARLRKHNLI